jgi:hypothetical protein
MTTKALRDMIERVQHWPEKRQEDAAQVLRDMENQDTASHHLTEEQEAEVRRRLADPSPRFLTLAEVRARLAQLGA